MSVISHRPTFNINMVSKKFFSPFSWGFRQFLIFQKSCSWKQPRNAFLDDIQERAPGRPPGTRSWTGFGNLLWYSPKMLGTYTLEAMQM